MKLGIRALFFPKKSQIYAKHNPTHDCSNKIRNAVITNSNQQWNIDITYFILRKNVKSYLFVIRDAFNGRIVNYKYSLKFDMNLVLDTVENSLNLNIVDNLVIHSDHGSQFISNDFDKLLKVYNVTKSMSSLGSPNENQLIEGLFGKLKNTIKERKLKLSFTNMRLKIELNLLI